MEDYKFSVAISEELAKKALNYWFVRYVFDWKMAVAYLLLVIYVGYDLIDGSVTWITYAAIGLTIFFLFYVVFGYLRQRRILNNMLQKLDGGQIIYEISEDFVSVDAPYGTWKLKWDWFNGLMITNEFVLLLYEQGGYSTLPANYLSDDVIEFLVNKIEKQDGKIQDARSH